MELLNRTLHILSISDKGVQFEPWQFVGDMSQKVREFKEQGAKYWMWNGLDDTQVKNLRDEAGKATSGTEVAQLGELYPDKRI